MLSESKQELSRTHRQHQTAREADFSPAEKTKGTEVPLISELSACHRIPVWLVQRRSGTRLEAPFGNGSILRQPKRLCNTGFDRHQLGR